VTNRLARLINQLPEERLSGDSSLRITPDQLTVRSLREQERSGAIEVQRRMIKIVDQRVLDKWMENSVL